MVGTWKCLAAAVVVLLGMARAASAQEIPTSFDQLRVVVKPGDSVTVIDVVGHETRGKIRSLSSSSLELIVGDMPRLFAESEVRTISHQRHASLGTGAKRGFFIGVGLGALGVAFSAATGGVEPWMLVGAAELGGFGAAVGVGVAALIRRSHVVYVGGSPSSSKLTVTPVLLTGRKGVAISFGL